MQNFKDTEWEGLTENEMFLSHRKLVKTTISRKFPNNQAFCKAHMIELDDLVQLGNMGLLNAIRTFDKDGKSTFISYAINCISWSISTNSKVISLRNSNTQTVELVDIVSVEMNVSEDEETIILDTIEAKENTSDVAEDNVLIQKVNEFLKADVDCNEELRYIIISRMEGKTMTEIAKTFGKHRNIIGQRLTTQKAMRVKSRLLKFLENGE